MKHRQTSVIDDLEGLLSEAHGSTISIGEVVHRLREGGFAMLMMLFVLPNCVPFPVPPGTSTLLSVPLFFLTFQMLAGRKEPWIPRKIAERRVQVSTLAGAIATIARHLRRFEHLVRPRLAFASSQAGEILLALFWLAFAISIAVPLPGTNFIPGVGILVSAFGLINRDGVIVLIGVGIGLVGLAVTTMLLMAGGALIAWMV